MRRLLGSERIVQGDGRTIDQVGLNKDDVDVERCGDPLQFTDQSGRHAAAAMCLQDGEIFLVLDCKAVLAPDPREQLLVDVLKHHRRWERDLELRALRQDAKTYGLLKACGATGNALGIAVKVNILTE